MGNSLAVRLPAEAAKLLGVGEGDTLVGELSANGRLILSAEARSLGKAESRRMREVVLKQKVTTSVVIQVRGSARY